MRKNFGALPGFEPGTSDSVDQCASPTLPQVEFIDRNPFFAQVVFVRNCSEQKLTVSVEKAERELCQNLYNVVQILTPIELILEGHTVVHWTF